MFLVEHSAPPAQPQGYASHANSRWHGESADSFKSFFISLINYLMRPEALVQCMPEGYPVIDFNPVVLVATPLRLRTRPVSINVRLGTEAKPGK
jgi:hypothetical protein